jgi:hypothetical protein
MTPEETKQIDKLIAVGAVVEVSPQNTAKLVHLLKAVSDENVRMRETLEMIIKNSEFYSHEDFADYLMRFGHERAVDLAKQGLKGEADENN